MLSGWPRRRSIADRPRTPVPPAWSVTIIPACRHSQPVEARDEVVERRVEAGLGDGSSSRVNVRAERHRHREDREIEKIPAGDASHCRSAARAAAEAASSAALAPVAMKSARENSVILRPGRRIDFPSSKKITATQHAITTSVSTPCHADPPRAGTCRGFATQSAHRPEPDHRHPGKSDPSGHGHAFARLPRTADWVGGEIGVDVGGESPGLVQLPRVEPEAPELEIRQQEGQRDEEHRRAGDGEA